MSQWRQLDIAIVGGGIGGLAVATALRRAGHQCTVYERADFAGEVGASISCAANGTQWLHRWGVNVDIGRSVVLQKLILHDWETGEIQDEYDLSDYEDQWGYVYNMFHRVNMHQMFMDSATGEGDGPPAKLVLNHRCEKIDHERGEILFENGLMVRHDMVVGADGIGSAVRKTLDINPEKKQSTSTCYHCIVPTERVKRLGLTNLAPNSAIEFWGGNGIDKIVFSPCRDGEIHSFYCFFPLDKSDHAETTWNHEASIEELLAPFPNLDKRLLELFAQCEDIKPWRLWVHQPYTHWQVGRTCILGDAAHPMMPDQSQGACQAIEDSAALGLIFSKKYNFTSDINAGLRLYEDVRKPRASKVQAASARARENISERIGFSSHTTSKRYRVFDENEKLTIDEMNLYDMDKDVEQKARAFTENNRIQSSL